MAEFGKPAAFAGRSSLLLLLSLFLLLLVFFIVLNAQSVRESRKVRAVMGSVEHSFSIDPRLLSGHDTVASRTGTVQAVERLDGVGTLFATAVAVAKVDRVTPGRLMEVRLPADALFEPGTADLRPDRNALLDRVAASLADAAPGERPGERIEVDMLLAISPDLTPSQPPGPVERAGALARDLVARGAPASGISVGVERGEPGTARFVFAVRFDEQPLWRGVR
jgi:hypothetical protein